MTKQRILLIGIAATIAALLAFSKPLAISLLQARAPSTEMAQAASVNKPKPVQGTKVPDSVLTCIPNEGAKYELLGETKQEATDYYLLSIYAYADEDPTERWDALIQVDRSGCLLLHHLGSGLKPLSVYMPVEVARKLELQRYQHWITKAGSKEKFQQILIARGSDAGVPHYLSQEQVWALQQLGVQVPRSYRILSSPHSL
jgi:hypothetical protein